MCLIVFLFWLLLCFWWCGSWKDCSQQSVVLGNIYIIIIIDVFFVLWFSLTSYWMWIFNVLLALCRIFRCDYTWLVLSPHLCSNKECVPSTVTTSFASTYIYEYKNQTRWREQRLQASRVWSQDFVWILKIAPWKASSDTLWIAAFCEMMHHDKNTDFVVVSAWHGGGVL